MPQRRNLIRNLILILMQNLILIPILIFYGSGSGAWMSVSGARP